MAKTDIEFAGKLRDILTFLYENPEDEHRKSAYDIGINLINARFGACPKCGHVNTGGKFCSECGQQLAGEVVRENKDIESVDYIVGKVTGNTLHIYAITDVEESAVESLRHHLCSGLKADLFKRTVEKMKIPKGL